MFSQEAIADQSITHLFSVSTPGQRSVKYRSIVYHVRSENGLGSWTCSRDGNSHCGHISSARHHLQKLVHADPHAHDLLVKLVEESHGM